MPDITTSRPIKMLCDPVIIFFHYFNMFLPRFKLFAFLITYTTTHFPFIANAAKVNIRSHHRIVDWSVELVLKLIEMIARKQTHPYKSRENIAEFLVECLNRFKAFWNHENNIENMNYNANGKYLNHLLFSFY